MTVSIIIPTTGTPDRRSSLLRAIQSILDQDSVDVVPIVVLNGERYDADLFDLLKVRRDIRSFILISLVCLRQSILAGVRWRRHFLGLLMMMIYINPGPLRNALMLSK